MNIGELLSVSRIVRLTDVSSKKRALEILSDSMANDCKRLSQDDVFSSLNARERLGSTGLGHGVAIPHGRVKGNDIAMAAMLQLNEGVDYDAMDDEPVDLIFALLVPENSTDEHLDLLAQLAEFLSKPNIVEDLRNTKDSAALLELLRKLPSPA